MDSNSRLPEELEELCESLRSSACPSTLPDPAWPAASIQALQKAEVFRWFIPQKYGGLEWGESEIVEGYLELSQACLTTTFILTQWNAACKRILGSTNEELKARLLPDLASGEQFGTVGISHLTTSRQHLGKPVLSAQTTEGGFILQGMSPWVTAAAHADVLVVGATLEDMTQVLLAVDSQTPGVRAKEGEHLVGLSQSCTGQVEFDEVFVPEERLIAGPVENVLSAGTGGGAGGLQTSTLAIGLSLAAVGFLQQQTARRPELEAAAAKLAQDALQLKDDLLLLVDGQEASCSGSDLRQQANSLVLRATQAALMAAKGAGYLASHPTGRWATEALFFLVWSCPQPVAAANLCELAQIEG